MTKLEWLSAARDKLELQEGQEMLLQISWGAWERVDWSKWGAGGDELGSQADPRPPKALRPPSRSSQALLVLGMGETPEELYVSIFVFSEFTYAI